MFITKIVSFIIFQFWLYYKKFFGWWLSSILIRSWKMVEYYDNVGFSVKNSFWSKIGFLSRMNFWRIFYYSAKQNWAPVEHRLTTVSKQVKTIVPLNSKHEKRSSTPLKPQSTTQKILLSSTLISSKYARQSRSPYLSCVF